MSGQPQKRSSFKPKFEEKNKIVTKFNFVFDEQKINFKTQLPQLPTKLKSKPNAQKHKQKIDELQSKIDSLKQERKSKKAELKKGSQDFDKQIQKLTKNVDLGKKCLIVLNYDSDTIAKSLQDVEEKISKKTRLLRSLQRGPREIKHQKKSYEQMTFEELEAEELILSTRVSTANLSKKEQSEINLILSKLARMKTNAPHGEKPVDNSASIEAAQQSLDRLKVVKESLQRELAETKNKIEAIQQDIEDFKQEISDLEEQKKNPEEQALAEQCDELKKQIYSLREEVATLEQEFENKKAEYDYEQAKVEWIKWATEVQKRKNEEWEAERQQRRKQRLREKNKQKNGETKDAGTTQAGKTEEEGKPERKRINKNQKQIDTCTFLISYCEGLINTEKPQQKEAQKAETGKDIQKALKSGEWSKMKDLQVVKSKKSNLDDQANVKTEKIKKKKTQKAVEEQAETVPKAFNHQFFTQQAFDSVKVVPPSKAEEVDSIIKQLNEKLVYFLEHPEESYDREQKTERNDRDKQKYTAQKYAKAKFTQREKKVVNTQDFPSLQ